MEKDMIIIHHTAVSYDKNPNQFEATNNYHKTRNFGTTSSPAYPHASKLGFYVQYHYMIEKDGKVIKCADESEIKWHASNYDINKRSIGLCMTGNFDIEYPTKEQLRSLNSLILEIKTRHNIKDIEPHRAYAPYKSCPGKLISKEMIDSLEDFTKEYVEDKTLDWQKKAIEDGIKNGITKNGERPLENCTRVEAIAFCNNLRNSIIGYINDIIKK
jgi:N-acetyl-anhydromuramyl-L-alanine amidase AmpD